MADKDLVEAERHLDAYIEDNKCGWCRKQGRKILDAAKELRAASPTALGITKEFEERIGETAALDGLDSQKRELSEQAEKTRGFKARLDQVLKKPREKVRERRPLGPRGRGPVEAPPANRGEPRMPSLPGFMTPDEVGQNRQDDMERFKSEGNRHVGPVRERFRFRVWKRIEDK